MMSENKHEQSRRDFLRKVGYIAPVILTMKALPAIAGHGSHCQTSYHEHHSRGREKHGFNDGPPHGLAKKASNFDFNDYDARWRGHSSH